MILHVYSDFVSSNPDTRRRMDLARQTWREQKWVEVPIQNHQVRRFADELGEVPIVKDMVDLAVKNAGSTDIVCLSNSDICFADNASIEIVCHLQKSPAIFCNRRDFIRLDKPLSQDEIRRGHEYCGTDLFAFRVVWWDFVKHSIPDMLLGREAWDSIFRKTIQLTCQALPTKASDLTYHERHPSGWEQSVNRYRVKGQIHNLTLALNWCRMRGINPREFGIP